MSFEERLEPFGGNGHKIIFAHANGYPPGSYRQFITPLLDTCEVTGYHHRPMWSSRVPRGRFKWSYFSRDLANTLRATQSGPVWLMGHSMGATIAVLAAAKEPQLFRGLILLDPVFLPTRAVLAMRMAPDASVQKVPMVRKTLARPNRFPDHQSAFDFHRAKRPYAAISDEVLWDYIHAGFRAGEDQGLELAFSREWEAGVYASAPWIWPALARVKLPTLGLRGQDSNTLTPTAYHRWGKLQPGARLHQCPGGHLLPMEHPEGTARYVLDFMGGQAT